MSSNDNNCGAGRTSFLRYTVPAGADGTYQLQVGCYGGTSCSGTAAYVVL